MSSSIEMEDLRAKRTAAIADDPNDTLKGGRLNLDADQEQAVALWAYASTVL